jgi:hypothetical protein
VGNTLSEDIVNSSVEEVTEAQAQVIYFGLAKLGKVTNIPTKHSRKTLLVS